MWAAQAEAAAAGKRAAEAAAAAHALERENRWTPLPLGAFRP